jgi:sec-independent protein translocase protein TatB
MGSLTFSELATIAVIVLIVFGPRRLPELARRAGVIMSKVRDATRELRDELREEYEDTIAPLEEVRRDLEAARQDVTEAARSVTKDLEAAGAEVTDAARAAGEDLEAAIDPDSAPPGAVSEEVATDAAAGAPPGSLEDVRRQLREAREELTATPDTDTADGPASEGGEQ